MSKSLNNIYRDRSSLFAMSVLVVAFFALSLALARRSNSTIAQKDLARSASIHLTSAHLGALNRNQGDVKEGAVTADLIPSYPEFVSIDGTAGVGEVALCQQLEVPYAVDSGSFGWSGNAKGSSTQSSGISPTGCTICQGSCTCGANEAKWMLGVDRTTRQRLHAEPQWSDQQMVPWESYAYGEYIGPFRTPHVSEYRLRIRDQVDFTYTLTREHLSQPYQIYAGDTLQLFSGADPTLNQKDIVVLSDGTISLPLVGRVRASGKTIEKLGEELNELYSQFVKMPAIIVQVTKGDTPATDLINAVIARVGLGGQQFQVEIAPDGTVSLPLLGQVPAIGLTLRELGREVNTRYAARIRGLNVTPVLRNRAPRSVFVLGEVLRPGRIQIDGPTTVMQAIAMAEGWKRGSNLRQIVVFRRDQDWRLMATRIDLQGALLGKTPYPSDEIWLRDSDIVLVPKTPILRASEAVDLYMTRTLYSIFPQQGVVFTFDNFQTF